MEWISVKDELPKDNQKVNILKTDNGTIRTLVDNDSPLFKSLNTFCKKNMPSIYKCANILELRLCENDGGEYYVATVDTKFCMNICGEHNSNRIYYYINKKAIYQKCFCTCDTIEGRISGLRCSEYRSSERPLGDILKYKLFPKERQKKQNVSKMNYTLKEDELSLTNLNSFLDNLYDKINDKRDEEDKMFG